MAWISMIVARSLRHLARLDIALGPSSEEPRHLILHGPNGSGKSSLLNAMAEELDQLVAGKPHPATKLDRAAHLELRMAHMGRPVRLEWTTDEKGVTQQYRAGELVLLHLPRHRSLAPPKSNPPMGTIPAPPTVKIAHRLGGMLMGRSQAAAVARKIDDAELAIQHESWVLGVRSALRRLLQQPELKLVLDSTEPQIDLPDGRRMGFADLASGHASAVTIFAEILLRVEAARQTKGDPTFQPEGVVIIDGVEADLDPRLCRELLPTLAELFPRIQLIVSTHSPLVAMSLDKALVYDVARQSGRSSSDLRSEGLESVLARMLGLSPGGLPSRPPPATLPPPKKISDLPPIQEEKTNPSAPFAPKEGNTILGAGPNRALAAPRVPRETAMAGGSPMSASKPMSSPRRDALDGDTVMGAPPVVVEDTDPTAPFPTKPAKRSKKKKKKRNTLEGTGPWDDD